MGAEPPFTGIAVKTTCCPTQNGVLAETAIDTEGAIGASLKTVIAFDKTMPLEEQPIPPCSAHVTTCPFVKL